MEKVTEGTPATEFDPDVQELARRAQQFKDLCRKVPGIRGGTFTVKLTPEGCYNVQQIKTRIEGR